MAVTKVHVKNNQANILMNYRYILDIDKIYTIDIKMIVPVKAESIPY